MCVRICGERHQEDPPVGDVVLFGGAHVRKEFSKVEYVLYPQHINEHAFIYYTCMELSIFVE